MQKGHQELFNAIRHRHIGRKCAFSVRGYSFLPSLTSQVRCHCKDQPWLCNPPFKAQGSRVRWGVHCEYVNKFRGPARLPFGRLGAVRGFRLPEKHEEQHVSRHDGVERTTVTLRDLGRLLWPERNKLVFAAASILVSSGATMAVPTIFGMVIDSLSTPWTGEASETLEQAGMMMLGVTAAGSVAGFLRVSLLDIVGQRVGRTLRKRLFSNLMAQELGFFDITRTGELTNRLSTDVHEVAEHLTESLTVLATASVTSAFAAGCLVMTSPALSTVTLVMVPATALGGAMYARSAKQLSKDLLDNLAKSTHLASERLSSIRVVRSFAAEGRETYNYSSRVDDSYGMAKRLAVAEGLYTSSVFFVSHAATLATLWMGTGMVTSGEMTVGSLAAFGMYTHKLGEAVSDLTEGVSGVARAKGAGGRLFSLLERAPLITEGHALPSFHLEGRVEFKGIDFAYPSSPDVPVLQGFNLTVEPGEVVGITGASGCGKSTLSFLLDHMYEPSRGVVEVDGMDVKVLDPRWLRGQVAVVGQNPVVFAGTIRDNIAYGRPGATIEEIKQAARVTNASEFIERLPEGYYSNVGDRGESLSGGQRQRLVLARAVLADPAILILDEATSALDMEGEMTVQRSVLDFMQGRTCFIITHHINMLRVTDRVVVIGEGKVVQNGTFDELQGITGGALRTLSLAPGSTKPH